MQRQEAMAEQHDIIAIKGFIDASMQYDKEAGL
jgi:hypothetical protein